MCLSQGGKHRGFGESWSCQGLVGRRVPVVVCQEHNPGIRRVIALAKVSGILGTGPGVVVRVSLKAAGVFVRVYVTGLYWAEVNMTVAGLAFGEVVVQQRADQG